MEDLTTIQFGRYCLAVPTSVAGKVKILLAKGKLKKIYKKLDEEIETLEKTESMSSTDQSIT